MSHSMHWTSDTHLLALILGDLLSFCSFLSSQPLYLAYFLFFFPYVLQLFSFLSQLLLSTSLLLLALLTVSQHLNDPTTASSELLGNGCAAILDILKVKLESDATFGLIEQYSSMVLAMVEDHSMSSFQESIALAFPSDGSKMELEAMGEASCEYLSIASEVSDSPTELPLENAKQNGLLVHNFEDQMTDNVAANASKAWEIDSDVCENLGKASLRYRKGHARSVSEGIQRDGSIRNASTSKSLESLSRDGSMRREREWKRTLACKLYEERMTLKLCEERTVAEGCEEMDLLWEAYEADAIKSDKPFRNTGKKKEKKDEHKEEEECEEETTGELCCLQALRLSAGKMNLGVGRLNFFKFSKAFKGMGFLHRVGSRRSRKG